MTPRQSAGWRVERCQASASDLLDTWPSGDGHGAAVRAGRVSGRSALVLGSTQSAAVVDAGRAEAVGIDVLRRSTGGGAVLVAPDAQVWFDIWVPRAHALWDDDIITAAGWLGDVWVAALESLGARSLQVHRGPATRGDLSDLVCFAGLGPGEVYVGSPGGNGPKVVGLAQRRTRAGARFHASAPLRWDPDPLVELLAAGDDVRQRVQNVVLGLDAVVALPSGVDDALVIARVEDAFLSALP